MEIDKGSGPAMWTNHGDAIYINADKSAIVAGDSPEAAYLLVGEGGQIPIDVAQQYDLIGSQLPERGRGRSKDAGPDVARDEDDNEQKAKSAPANKAKDAPTNKGR